MKKYFYSCTYPWMCRSFDGFYLAPTKDEMEVSHKTVALASLILGLILWKIHVQVQKWKTKKTPLLFVFVMLFIPASYKKWQSLSYPMAAKTLWICSILHNSIDLLPNEYKSFFLQLFPIQRQVPWCLCDPLHQQYPNSRLWWYSRLILTWYTYQTGKLLEC